VGDTASVDKRDTLKQLAYERASHPLLSRKLQLEVRLQHHHRLGDENLMNTIGAGDCKRVQKLKDEWFGRWRWAETF
jgi:hypothetical protein